MIRGGQPLAHFGSPRTLPAFHQVAGHYLSEHRLQHLPLLSTRWRGRLCLRCRTAFWRGSLLLGQGYLESLTWLSVLLEVSSFPPGLRLAMSLLPRWGGGTQPLVALLSESCRDLPSREVTLWLTRVVSRMRPARVRPSVHLVGWRVPGRWLMDTPAQEPLSCPLQPSFLPSKSLQTKLLLSRCPSSAFSADLPCSSFHTTRRTARPGDGLKNWLRYVFYDLFSVGRLFKS